MFKVVEGHKVYSIDSLKSWAFSSVFVVLTHVIVVLLYSLVVFFVHNVASLSLFGFSIPLQNYFPPFMLTGCIVLISMLTKDALRHHTYGDFKQHRTGIFLS